ncbi:putative secreted protein [Wickerhamomyces ciferrii]|uniref:Protein ROT1 n=1 Tax=Wickerhamomyces ciferrii (strain ATCC 14091 / BCRC 22168 / CBS 111 / JCM 3599 / NBRC 0793 / NRRL Y-1031 F-60-10) TaxID=1206466 RepID=K0KXH5_WICCF|nr:uncharacterized protein BN7_5773 [Wickerhamomyces ciferrii]CCH46184.1 putative secreted protein [Wickerhamomyces ciferrii]
MQILSNLLILGSIIAGVFAADDDASIVGTWASKSNTVFTGPGFYDPVDELLIEPALPGISYSFTEDGHFEQALYRVTSNAKNHSCPAAVIIYQHGTYEKLDNGTLVLTPIEVDGRQLLSEPCKDGGVSTYSRYDQVETFEKFQVMIDNYHGRWKLQLYEWDGNPVQPLYLAYRPALMLPTETLNPTDGDHATGTSTPSGQSLRKRVRRSLENRGRTNAVRQSSFDNDFWWWTSVGLVSVGSLSYFFL